MHSAGSQGGEHKKSQQHQLHRNLQEYPLFSQNVSNKYLNRVTPAEAGVQETTQELDSGFRRNDVERP